MAVVAVDLGLADSRLGLAVEEALLSVGPPGFWLLLWRSRPIVVSGRRPQPGEVDCSLAASLGVPTARRRSGGGSVYHDEGCLLISLVRVGGRLGVEEILSRGSGLLAGALRLLGLPAWVENMSDVVVWGWKVSGGAARITGRGWLYHATLLVSSDEEVLYGLTRPLHSRVKAGEVTPAKYRPASLRRLAPWVTVADAEWAVLEEAARALGGLARAELPGLVLDEASRLLASGYPGAVCTPSP